MTTNQMTTHPTAPTAGVQSGAQHTPGPWAAIPCSDGTEITAGKYRIALIGESVRFSESEPRANARLIASAPELLAALEAVAADPRMVRLRTEHQTMIRTAIAKARGNQ